MKQTKIFKKDVIMFDNITSDLNHNQTISLNILGDSNKVVWVPSQSIYE